MPQALILKTPAEKPSGPVYYDLQLVDVPQPTPGEGEVLVKIHAWGLNHRDLFIRQHQYPAISFTSPMLADGAGTVAAVGPGAPQDLADRAVVLSPSLGWDSDPLGPEKSSSFTILGSSKLTPLGTAQEYVCVAAADVEPTPPHLSAVEAAALPLCGVTAWRALTTKSGAARPGTNILVTGIGGGVALMLLQFGAAMGCNVYVTSSDAAKLARATGELGAKGGVNYKSPYWEKELLEMLPQDRKFLDAVIDGAGGDIVARTSKIIKPGGVIVQYGMTVAPKMDWSMAAVLKNIELRGTTMGSRKEFGDMIDFIRDKKIKPVVSRVAKGLDIEAINGLFEDMKAGKQFGKLVIQINSDASSRL